MINVLKKRKRGNNQSQEYTKMTSRTSTGILMTEGSIFFCKGLET